MDHISYYDYLDVDREDCNDAALSKLFERWFDAAIFAFGWLGGNPEVVGTAARAHLWDWTTHKVADEKSQALANQNKLASGQILLPQLYSQSGLDFDDEVERAAPQLGISSSELRKRLLDASLPVKPEAKPELEQAVEEEDQEAEDRRVAALVTKNRL